MRDDVKNKILALREQDQISIREISTITGVSFGLVKKIVEGTKIDKRPFFDVDTNPKYREKNEEIRRLRAEGVRVVEITKMLGVNEHRVYHVCRDMTPQDPNGWKQNARADFEAGYTREELRSKYNRSKSVINRTLEGLAGASREPSIRRSQENRDRVLALRLEDKSSTEISEITGLSRNTVQRIAQDVGHPFKHPVALPKRGRQEAAARTRSRNDEAVRALRLQGKSSLEIAEATGLGRKMVQTIAKRIGHPFVQMPPPSRRGSTSPHKKPNNPFNQKHMPISAEEARTRMVKLRIANQMTQFNNSGRAGKVSLPRLTILESEDA